jgi:hypothetical protein
MLRRARHCGVPHFTLAVRPPDPRHPPPPSYRVRDEWFRCSVSTAINAILCVAEAAGESGPFKARDEWIEEQAQAVVIIWRYDRYIPTAMRPRVDQLREEAKKKAREEAEKAGENLYWLTVRRPWSRRLSPRRAIFWGRRAVEGQILPGNVSPLSVRLESIKIPLNLLCSGSTGKSGGG